MHRGHVQTIRSVFRFVILTRIRTPDCISLGLCRSGWDILEATGMSATVCPLQRATSTRTTVCDTEVHRELHLVFDTAISFPRKAVCGLCLDESLHET